MGVFLQRMFFLQMAMAITVEALCMLKSISLSGSRFDSTKMYVIATCQDEYIFDFTQSSHHIYVKKNIDLTLHSKRLSNMQLIAAQSVDFILNFSAMSL